MERGQTETISVVLLLVVVIGVSTTVGVAALTTFSDAGDRGDAATLTDVTVEADELVVDHTGGEPLDPETVSVQVRDPNGTTVYDLGSDSALDGEPPWSPGDRWTLADPGYSPGDEVTVLVVHRSTNTIVTRTTRRVPATPAPGDGDGGDGDGGDGGGGDATETTETATTTEPTETETPDGPRGDGLSDLSVGNLSSGESDQTQTVSFTLDGALSAGETVTVDLSDAQDSHRRGQVIQVQYRDATVDDDRVTVDAKNENASVTFTADEAVADGETVTVTIRNVETAEDHSDEHEVTATRSDADGADSTTFVVRVSGDKDIEGENWNGDLYVEDDLTVEEASINGNVTAGGDVTLAEDGTINGVVNAGGTITVEEDGTMNDDGEAGGDVTVAEGGEINGDLETGGSLTVAGPINGNVTADGSVTVEEDGSVENLDSEGGVTVNEDGTVYDDVDSDGTVKVNEGGTIHGDVFVGSGDDIECEEGAEINGQPCEEYVEENY